MDPTDTGLPKWQKKLKFAHNCGIAFVAVGSLLILAAFCIATKHNGKSDQWPEETGRRDWSTIENVNIASNLQSTKHWYQDLDLNEFEAALHNERQDQTINSSKSTLFSNLTHYTAQNNNQPQLKSTYLPNDQSFIQASKKAYSLTPSKHNRDSLSPPKNIDQHSEKHNITHSYCIKSSSMMAEQKHQLPNEASFMPIERQRIFSEGSLEDSFSEDLEQVNALPNRKRSRNRSQRSGSLMFRGKNRNMRSDEFLTAKCGSSVLGGGYLRTLSFSPHSHFKAEESDEFLDCLSKAAGE